MDCKKKQFKLYMELVNDIKSMAISELLILLKNRFSNDVAMTTAGGYSGSVLLYYIKDYFPDLPIYFIDTGYHFKQTLNLINIFKREWKLNIITIRPTFDKSKLVTIVGKEPYKINPNLCCHYLKVEPLLRVLHTKKVWLSAIRKDQSITRAKLSEIEIDGRGVIKIYPLLNYTKNMVWEQIKNKKIFYNNLYDKGYSSIGCFPCTNISDDEREGRWKSCPKLECGVNIS